MLSGPFATAEVLLIHTSIPDHSHLRVFVIRSTATQRTTPRDTTAPAPHSGLPCDCGPECGASAVVSRDVVLCVAVLQVMKTGGGSGLGLRLGFIAPGIVRSGMVHVAVCVCYTANYQILPCSLEYQQFYQLRILTLSPMRGIINLAHVRPRF